MGRRGAGGGGREGVRRRRPRRSRQHKRTPLSSLPHPSAPSPRAPSPEKQGQRTCLVRVCRDAGRNCDRGVWFGPLQTSAAGPQKPSGYSPAPCPSGGCGPPLVGRCYASPARPFRCVGSCPAHGPSRRFSYPGPCLSGPDLSPSIALCHGCCCPSRSASPSLLIAPCHDYCYCYSARSACPCHGHFSCHGHPSCPFLCYHSPWRPWNLCELDFWFGLSSEQRRSFASQGHWR